MNIEKLYEALESIGHYYKIAVVTWNGTVETRLVSEENIVPYKDLDDLDQEIEDFLMDYYNRHPLATA